MACIRRNQKRLYLWYCAAAYISFLLVFMGLGSSTWSEYYSNKEIRQSGLLASCAHNQNTSHACQTFQFGQEAAWLDACRILAGLSVTLLFSLTPVSCYLHYQDERREDVLFFTVFGVFSAILGLIGAILYGILRDANNGELTWGFAVYFSGHVFALVAFLILCISNQCRDGRKRIHHSKPTAPSSDNTFWRY